MNARRRALQHNAFVEDVDRAELWRQHQGKCGICNQPVKLNKTTIDHIIPLCRGGDHSYENCQPAHSECNMIKDDMLPEELLSKGGVEALRQPKGKQRKLAYINLTGRTAV